MSKERLKQFKNSLDFLDDSADMSDYHRLIDTLENLYRDGELDWIHRFASKQSGRVESLQERLNAKITLINKGDEEDRYYLQEQNNRYRDSLINCNIELQKLFEDVFSFDKDSNLREIQGRLLSISESIQKALEGDPHD